MRKAGRRTEGRFTIVPGSFKLIGAGDRFTVVVFSFRCHVFIKSVILLRPVSGTTNVLEFVENTMWIIAFFSKLTHFFSSILVLSTF